MLKNEDGNTPKDLADEEGHEESSILLGAVMAAESAAMGADYDFSAPVQAPEPPKTPEMQLCHAAYDGDMEAVMSLLAKKVSPNCRGEENNTPLHRAAQTGRRDVAQGRLERLAVAAAEAPAARAV